MNLHPEATEYAHIPMSGVPADAGTLEVSFDGGTTWHDTTWNTDKTYLIDLARAAGTRLGVIGGAGSLLVAQGGPKLMDTDGFPAEILPEVRTGRLAGCSAAVFSPCPPPV